MIGILVPDAFWYGLSKIYYPLIGHGAATDCGMSTIEFDIPAWPTLWNIGKEVTHILYN